jgi:hypothetical protein
MEALMAMTSRSPYSRAITGLRGVRAMTAEIPVVMDQGFVRVLYRGDVDMARTAEMLRKAGRVAAENGTFLMLFDVREAGAGEYHVNAIRHTQQATSLGIDQRFSVAFLAREGDVRMSYVENVMSNRGFRVKVFVDEAQAVAWLTGAA